LENKAETVNRVLDIGTGSGCIALAIKSKRPQYDLVGIDVSEAALELAHANAEKYELRIDFKLIDFLNKSQWQSLGKFNQILSNPPYISRLEKSKMSDSTVKYEPEIALYPEDDDVLIFYKSIAEFGKSHLSEEGRVYLECNEFNSEKVKEIFINAGYPNTELIKDLQQKDRFVTAKLD
jgi:release factor glutamine methyltransferase